MNLNFEIIQIINYQKYFDYFIKTYHFIMNLNFEIIQIVNYQKYFDYFIKTFHFNYQFNYHIPIQLFSK